VSSNPLKQLGTLGQSIWLDYIRRDPISSGQLRHLIIGPNTVNNVPIKTLDAYCDHGEPKARLEQDVEEARPVLERLPELGIGMDNPMRRLEDEGVEKFIKPFDKLMGTVAPRSARHLTREA
jgi:transaldolase